MKKILAIALVVVMLTIAASASTLEVWINKDTDKGVNMSFDTCYLGSAMYNQPDGNADVYITENPITVGDVATIATRGWTGAAAPIDKFGYKINDGEYVFGDFAQATEDPVKTAGGENASRFQVEIPVAGLTAPTLLTTAYKTTDGKIVDIIVFSVNGEYVAEQPSAPTSDAAVVVVAAIAAIAVAGVVVVKKVRA